MLAMSATANLKYLIDPPRSPLSAGANARANIHNQHYAQITADADVRQKSSRGMSKAFRDLRSSAEARKQELNGTGLALPGRFVLLQRRPKGRFRDDPLRYDHTVERFDHRNTNRVLL